jgi:hypothetical protein
LYFLVNPSTNLCLYSYTRHFRLLVIPTYITLLFQFVTI